MCNDAVRRLPMQWRDEAERHNKTSAELEVKGWNDQRAAHLYNAETKRYCAGHLETALAKHDADGDSPAVPDGYVLVPQEPTRNMLLQLIVSIMTVEDGNEAVELLRKNYRRAIAAAPTPPDDGEK